MAHYFLIGQAVYGDGRFYYSYARSLALQGDLDIKDELTHAFSPQDNNTQSDKEESFTGYPVQSLGPSLFWAPVLYVSNHLALRLGLLSNGFSDIYQISVGLFSIALSALAFHRLGKLLSKKLKSITVFLTLILVWAGTNLFFYTAIDTINTHFFSFSLSVFALCEYLEKKQPSLLLTGLLTGLALQNRQLDILFHLGLFAAYFISHLRIADLIKYTSFILLASLPQLLVWNFQFSSPLPPMAGEGFWRFSPFSILSIFFDLPQGLLFTAPIMLIASLLILFKTKSKYIYFSSISFVLFIILIGFWWSPLGGAAYGPRFLITFYPIFTLVVSSRLKLLHTRSLMIFALIFVTLSLLNTLYFLYVSP